MIRSGGLTQFEVNVLNDPAKEAKFSHGAGVRVENQSLVHILCS